MKKLFQVSALVAVFHFFLPFSSEGADAGVGLNNPTGVTGEYNGSITTAGSYDPFTGNAKRMVDDLTVTGSVGAYPLKWTRIKNSRAGGGGWGNNYQWGLFVRPAATPNPCRPLVPDAKIHYPEGGERVLFKESDGHYVQIDGWEPMGERLEYMGSDNYDVKLKDGGRVEFRPVAGIGRMPTAIVDPYGLRTRLDYESGHLRKITEPGGRFLLISYTTFSYPNTTNPPIPPLIYVDLITQVEAQDGRGHLMEKVIYTYTPVPSGGDFEVTYFMLTDVAYDGNDNPHATYTYYPPAPLIQGLNMPGELKTCQDVRYSGAMKNIEYLYLQHPTQEACGMAEGQIKEERNLSTHQAISKVIYPTASECVYPFVSARFKRKEMRPDGAIREFQYNSDNAELESYTDFYYPGETPRTTTITYDDNVGPDDHYQRIVTDALQHFTKTEKEKVVGAVMAVIHNDGSSVRYEYTDPANPYYLLTQTDERSKITQYVRYPVGGPNANLVHWIYYPDGGSEEFTYNAFGQVLTHLMTSGGTEVFEYDTRGLKTTYTPPSTSSDLTPQNNPTRYYYYGSGPNTDRLQYVVDPRQNATWYEYNGRGQVTKVTHQDTKFTQSGYNPDGTVASTIDELGYTTQYAYDEYKRVTTTTNLDLNEVVKTSYDPNHENGADLSLTHTTPSIYRVTSPMLRKTDHDYDANFRRKWTIQASGTEDEALTQYFYDWVGNLVTVEDPRQKITTYHYDERNRQDSVKNEELNETTSLHYDPANNKDRETRPDGFFRTWGYDEMSRLNHAYDWRIIETPTADQTTTYTRDHAGNATSIKDTKGAIYTFVYDHLNRRESATNPSDATLPARTETWLYDIAGNLDTYTNPDEKRRHFHYDSRNRQDHSWWDGGLGIGQDIVIGYDDASRVTSIKTMNDTTPITTVAFGYDAANRKIWEDQTLAPQPPRRVKTPLDHDGKRMNLQITDPPTEHPIKSREMAGSGSYFINYGYTYRNQLKTIDGEGGAWAFNYVYDASGNMTTRQAQYNGRTSSTSCPTENYDAFNRPATWSQTGPNGFYKLSHYQYDLAKREKATWRDEDGGTGERFEYEASNQLKKVSYSMPAPAPSPTPSASPTPPGASPTPPNATPTPGQQVNEVTFTQTTGGAGNVLVTMSTTTANAVIFFTYSDTGNPPPDPTHTGSTAGPGTTRYVAPNSVPNGTVRNFRALAYHEGMTDSEITEYDVDNNGDGPNAVGRTVTYQYTPDKLNRSSVTDNGVTTLYSPNPLNQYTSVAGNSLSYDNNFNLTHTVGFNGIYDAGNLLVAASNGGSGEAQQTIAGFIYDGLGRCVKRTFNGVGTILVYDGWKPIAEWEATVPGYFQAWNVYGPGPDDILLRQGGKYGYMRFHLDRHGNVAFLVDNDGVIQEKYTYDVFGKPKIMDAAGTERPFSYYGHCFLFQGREYIRQLGIYDYRHRFYHPELGRFIQTDPIGLQTEGTKLSAEQTALFGDDAPAMFSSSELNLYRYCNDDPVDRSDPSGLYGRRFGFTDDEWKKVDIAQQSAADKFERASKVMDAKVFEKVFGPGSATVANMDKVQRIMKSMAAALRDDGTKGYFADAVHVNGRMLAQAPVGGKTMEVNVGHRYFDSPATLLRTVGHESGHSAGLYHGEVDGVTAYWGSRNKAERAAFDHLPSAGRLGNPDHYLSYAQFYGP